MPLVRKQLSRQIGYHARALLRPSTAAWHRLLPFAWRCLFVALGVGCASCAGPADPTPTATPTPGGTLSGRYTLEVKLAPACTVGTGTASFPIVLAPAGVEPHPGVQGLLDTGDPALLELELKYTDFTLEGGIGTVWWAGVVSDEGLWTSVNAVGTGHVTQTGDGRGQVLAGGLRGYLEVQIEGTEDETSGCTAADHSFMLLAR